MNNTTSTPLTNPLPKDDEKTIFKILVVDDEPDARELFKDMLTSNDTFEVSSAADGIEALAKAEATKFDLILLDIVMPRKDGVQVLSEIKKNQDRFGVPKILMLTNIGGDLAIEESLRLGANGYRLKSVTEPMELVTAVNDLLLNGKTSV
jgi:CheY-like chemotaxis protein